ncbi:MAG: MotA/TolQ/ExbB proton channel family protein [Pseudomonadota bacterium]
MDLIATVWAPGDAVTRLVAIMLLLASIASWVTILYKGWLLRRVRLDLRRSVAAFWAAPDLEDARRQLTAFDREGIVAPLLDAGLAAAPSGTLEAAGQREAQLTRRLRDALHAVVQRLQLGNVLLASIGATAPFVGLFGTVWGIYHAMLGISAAGDAGIDKIAGPVGEALIMTALGLLVAIPAVLAYNAFNKQVSATEVELEGYAHDLRELLLHRSA